MKIGLISDIHGNYEALRAVLSTLDRMSVQEIYCLGDVAGYYSQINECCNELIQRQIPCVMGNHDWYIAGGGFCPRSKSANDCINYQKNIITQDNLDWLRSFPIQRRIENIRMVHGGWGDPIDEYLTKPTEEYFEQVEGEIFISGHTHVQILKEFKHKVYCNPGSVGQPRDNDPRAAFATYDGKFYLHRVEYDMKRVFELMELAGFEDYYYGCLKTGAKNLCKLS